MFSTSLTLQVLMIITTSEAQSINRSPDATIKGWGYKGHKEVQTEPTILSLFLSDYYKRAIPALDKEVDEQLKTFEKEFKSGGLLESRRDGEIEDSGKLGTIGMLAAKSLIDFARQIGLLELESNKTIGFRRASLENNKKVGGVEKETEVMEFENEKSEEPLSVRICKDTKQGRQCVRRRAKKFDKNMKELKFRDGYTNVERRFAHFGDEKKEVDNLKEDKVQKKFICKDTIEGRKCMWSDSDNENVERKSNYRGDDNKEKKNLEKDKVQKKFICKDTLEGRKCMWSEPDNENVERKFADWDDDNKEKGKLRESKVQKKFICKDTIEGRKCMWLDPNNENVERRFADLMMVTKKLKM